MKRQPSVAEWVILAGGAVAFFFSFFSFWDQGGFSPNAWGDLAFPLATYVAIFGLVMAAQIALTTFTEAKLPEAILGFSWPQVHLILGLFNTLIMVGFLIFKGNTPDQGFGQILMLLGAIATLVGAILLTRERTATT
jgi:hypothetical protein